MPGRPTNEPSNYYAFGFQAAKDTEATTFQFLRHLDGTGFDVTQQTESVREGGDGQEVGLRYKTAISADGAAVANARPEVGIRLAVAALGADVTVATVGGALGATAVANEHTAVPTSKVPYLTLEQFWADEVERVANGMVTGLDIEFEAGRPLKLTAQTVGGGTVYKRSVASVLTAAREAGAPFMYPGASVSIDGVGNAQVTKGKISVKRNVDDAIRTNGLSREDVVALNFDTDVSLTLKFESATGIYDKTQYVQGGTQVPFDLATGAVSVFSQFGSGTNTRYLQVGVNAMHYEDAQVNHLDPDGKTMYIDVSAAGYRSATNQVFVRALIASAPAIQ